MAGAVVLRYGELWAVHPGYVVEVLREVEEEEGREGVGVDEAEEGGNGWARQQLVKVVHLKSRPRASELVAGRYPTHLVAVAGALVMVTARGPAVARQVVVVQRGVVVQKGVVASRLVVVAHGSAAFHRVDLVSRVVRRASRERVGALVRQDVAESASLSPKGEQVGSRAEAALHQVSLSSSSTTKSR